MGQNGQNCPIKMQSSENGNQRNTISVISDRFFSRRKLETIVNGWKGSWLTKSDKSNRSWINQGGRVLKEIKREFYTGPSVLFVKTSGTEIWSLNNSSSDYFTSLVEPIKWIDTYRSDFTVMLIISSKKILFCFWTVRVSVLTSILSPNVWIR